MRPLFVSLYFILLGLNFACSWNENEWGNPFEDLKFQKLSQVCRFGHDQYDCPQNSGCLGAPTGFCRCNKGYANPDPPGTEGKNTARCQLPNELEISDKDPRWSFTSLPCAAQCETRNATCGPELPPPFNERNCVCKEGFIADPTKPKECKVKPESSSGIKPVALSLISLLGLSIFALKFS